MGMIRLPPSHQSLWFGTILKARAFNGTVSRDFLTRFIHQTTSPSPVFRIFEELFVFIIDPLCIHHR
jgi:hypothetical protein